MDSVRHHQLRLQLAGRYRVRMTEETRPPLRPADGVAVLLHLVQAAREVASREGLDLDGQDVREITRWVRELDRWVDEAQPPPLVAQWEPRKWRELVHGDRVRMGTAEAEVQSTGTATWHVDPKSNDRYPRPLDHDVTHVRLVGREPLYRMPADGMVDTFRGAAGLALDEAARGREVPAEILGSWAGDAILTLVAAGLDPEVIDAGDLS